LADLGIQHAMRMHHSIICVACLATTVFFHIIPYPKNVAEDKACFDFL